MDVRFTSQPAFAVETDVLIFVQLEGEALPESLGEVVGRSAGSALENGDFAGEFGQSMVVYTTGDMAARKLMLYGLGQARKLTLARLRRAAGMAGREARRTGARTIAFAAGPVGPFSAALTAQTLVEGALHGLYRFETFKTDQKRKPQVESVVIAGAPELAEAVTCGQIIGDATNLARSVNFLPGNRLTATDLGARAEALGREIGLEVDVLDRAACRRIGAGLLLAVNQGSVEEPRLIVLRHRGGGEKGPWLGLVGKGVTFDTGGISIKGSEGMWDMKYDMSGAGAVLGAMSAIARLQPACNIMGIIGATDNMPDGGALKPGDVIAGLSGKTVEIRSTDAEGRLVLGDCVAYGTQLGCERMITVATLTGAVTIALGNARYGIVANDDEWEAEVAAAGETAGEPGWRLPHDDEYYELLRSPVADMTNGTVGRQAGTVAGGLFIMKHAAPTPTVHLDIASQAWKVSEDKYEDAGATGVGVKSLVTAALRFTEAKR